jgi:hypothetical protein
MGIIMGTSHHEPCAKAHQEWTRVKTRGPWNYDTNREELVRFWRDGIERMKALHESTDGFKIAEEDLRLRGPGEITGTAQSGELAFKIANLARDEKIMLEARKEAFSMIRHENDSKARFFYAT